MARCVRYLIAGACLVVVAVPATAVAKPGGRTFDATYPVASKLCAKVQAGQTPPALRGDGPQLVQACSALESAFSQAQAAVRTTQAQLAGQLQTDRSQRVQACQQARQSHQHGACKAAWQTFAQESKALRGQLKTANQQYFIAVEAARKQFWSTVRSLRGGKTLRPDAPVKK